MITSTTNVHVKQLRALAADRRERRQSQLFVIEGVRLVSDALASGAELTLVLFSPEQLATTEAGTALLGKLEHERTAFAASPAVISAAADTVHPQGVVALARWPQITAPPPGIILVLDGLQDPGNAGTLLRSAEACGVVEVIASRGSVDLFSPKVVRAAMGAHFRLALTQDQTWDQIEASCSVVDNIYVADAEATMPYYAADWRQPSALIIGNEAQGLSSDAITLATRWLSIPMRGGAESLNAGVAGSVILFEALRQRSLGRS